MFLTGVFNVWLDRFVFYRFIQCLIRQVSLYYWLSPDFLCIINNRDSINILKVEDLIILVTWHEWRGLYIIEYRIKICVQSLVRHHFSLRYFPSFSISNKLFSTNSPEVISLEFPEFFSFKTVLIRVYLIIFI